MIKIKRTLTKCLAALLAFVLLSCFCLALGTSCAEPQPEKEIPFAPPDDTGIFDYTPEYDEDISISVSFDYFGEKIKISENNYVNISYTVNDNVESPDPHNVLVRSTTPYIYHAYTPDRTDNVCYIMPYKRGGTELKKFEAGIYTTEYLYFYFENGSEEYNKFYSDGCTFDFSVDLRTLAADESIKNYAFILAVYTVPEATSGTFYRNNKDFIFLATDGEYVAFSDVSNEDAIFILTGELPSDEPSVEDPPVEEPPVEEPRGFWATLADFFDGCD